MTTERLEELARFADAEAEWSSQHGNAGRTQDFADLARCARAWAGIDALVQQNGAKCVSLWVTVDTKRALFTQRRCVTADSLIEAVEAAEVGK